LHRNVAATVYYERKELLDIRTVIAHLKLDEEFFNESDGTGYTTTDTRPGPDPRDSLEKETEI
jgi:hypothetical protein